MKVRWRKYELMLITLIVSLKLLGYSIDFHNYTAGRLPASISEEFGRNHIPFSFTTCIFLPRTGVIIFLYLAYLAVNFLIIPSFRNSNPRKFSTYLILAIRLSAISYLLGLAVNVAAYFSYPLHFSYLGYDGSALFEITDEPLKNLFSGFDRGLIFSFVLSAYVIIRDSIIDKIEHSQKETAYQVLVINKIGLIFSIYLIIPAISDALQLQYFEQYYTIYITFLTPIVVVYLINSYWLFPSDGKMSFNIQLLAKLILSTLIITLLFFGAFSSIGFHRDWWLLCWGILLLLVTPATWWIYRLNRDKLLELKGSQQALAKSNADLQFLRSQINPHFLFNTLNTLYGTALLENSLHTAAGIQKLGDMMRFMLEDNLQNYIPMSSEIAYLKNYIALQKLRVQMGGDVIIEEYLEEKDCNHLIVPMLLIPFVENAFKHGINPTERSWISIRLTCDPAMIRFEVRNSLHMKNANDPVKRHSGIGLNNVSERLELLYEGRYDLKYGVEGGEFKAELMIKLKYDQYHH